MTTITQNENIADRFARIIIGGALMLATTYTYISNIIVIAIFLILGLYSMFSGLAGYCVIYRIFGIKTSK